MKRLVTVLEKWGHYLLAALCAAVILLSALWTKSQGPPGPTGTLALSDQSQRLAEASPEPSTRSLVRPADGPILRPYSGSPVLVPDTGLWQTLPGMDFSVSSGDKLRSMAAGTVISCENGITIDHGDGLASRYEGPAYWTVRVGRSINAGEGIGKAAADGILRVILYQNANSQPFGLEWVDNPPNLSYNGSKRSIQED